MDEVTYETGEPAERLVEEWLIRRGYYVTPARTHRVSLDGAPLLHGEDKDLIQPDIFVIGHGRFFWAEVKQKTKPQSVRIRDQLEHGIEQRQLEHYKEVAEVSGQPVFLFVFEVSSGVLLCLNLAKETPYEPLSKIGSQTSTGAVMVNFARASFDVVEKQCDSP